MKNIHLLLFLFFISCFNNESQKTFSKSNNKINEDEIYEVINFVLNEMKKSDSLENYQSKYVVDELSIPNFIIEDNHKEKLNKHFTKSDLIFIQKQLNNKAVLRLSQNKIVRKTIISKDTLKSLENRKSLDWKNNYYINYKKKFGNYSYDEFSLPVFSNDKKTVLIEINSFLGGGCAVILKKKNKNWKAKIISIWTH